MRGFAHIKSPNLPRAGVTHAVVSGRYPVFIAALGDIGVTALEAGPCGHLAPPVAGHADMVFHHLGGDRALCEECESGLRAELTRLGFKVEDYRHPGGEYPGDVGLNACRVGDKIICLPNAACAAATRGLEVIPVKQGYSKCSVCVVDDHSIITDDESVAAGCRGQLDVLMVRKGCVRLEGYDCGFLGGCSGKLAPDVMAFCGSLERHPDHAQIKAFLAERGVSAVSLTGGELTDVGSIIPICEQA